ncbi:Extracellular serine-rich protein [Lachnellula hyalina]|uniref:Extracellular serine-rich protein n=1 Tax=Lachnellula hyalina TaxID=1316788 RepID=A0A8H8R211_9HELO|nr:Extracellular serine-rich protein [Lachnellula hyalina]TVY26954.1 Extracellular serine-rich protein [Lachnellula hyalina]
MQYTSSLVLAFTAAASAATIKVAVGQNGLTYTPNDITANAGDSVEFDFFPKNHTVSQSSFADPCHPLAGGFFSGFVPTNASTLGSTFTIVVKDTKPVWIYCSQTVGNHCQAGMVAAINAPKTGNTLAAFTLKASNATSSTFPPPGTPIGGTLVKSSGNTTSASNSSSSSSGIASGSGSGSSSVYTSTYTTTYATSATLTTSYSSTYTSNGQTYTTAVASTYTTAYTTAAVTTAVGSTQSIGAVQSIGAAQSTGAAGGLSVNMVGMGALALGALAMI